MDKETIVAIITVYIIIIILYVCHHRYTIHTYPKWVKHNSKDMIFNLYKIQNRNLYIKPISILLFDSIKNHNSKTQMIGAVDTLYKTCGANNFVFEIINDPFQNISYKFSFYLLSETGSNHNTTNTNPHSPNLIYPKLINSDCDIFKNINYPTTIQNTNLIAHSITMSPISLTNSPTNSTVILSPHIFYTYKNLDYGSYIEYPFYGTVTKSNIYDSAQFSKIVDEFVFDTAKNLKMHILTILKKLQINSDPTIILNILNKYPSAKYLSIIKKIHKPNRIALKWIGILDSEFMDFLINNGWPKYIIKSYKKNKHNLKQSSKEIMICFDFLNNKEIRTVHSSFFGLI